jgi:hypothetical protein
VKAVKNGVYETSKMRVEISSTTVSKTFKRTANANTRYQREIESLKRLSSLPHFPNLISFDDTKKDIKMSRLSGTQPKNLSQIQIELLRKMVVDMHEKGVARHAIPIRDLLSPNEHELGMVDFERVTLRSFRLSPIWLIAKKVSNYHLFRLIHTHQPQMLSEAEKRLFLKLHKFRKTLQLIKPLKNRLKLLFEKV